MKASFLLPAFLLIFILGGCVGPPRQIYIQQPEQEEESQARVERVERVERKPTAPTAPRQADQETIYTTVSVERGIASYYYGRWIGRKTANGEIYRASDVTAAHKTLPFNTMVRVTNLRNNKSVILRINNRGPFIKGRIIDLSLEAARRIQMTEAGIVPVTVEVLRKVPIVEQPTLRRPTPSPTPKPQSTPRAG